MSTAMKPIVYRGGLVSFAIPAHWRDEYEAQGGGTFYEAGEHTGTLRLNVISFERPDVMALDAATRQIFDDGPHEVLPCGFPMRQRMAQTEEQGTPLHIHRWEILVPVSGPRTRFRMVCFTHTVEVAQEGTPRTKDELTMINALVRAAIYSTELGVLPKPWWKFCS